MESSGLLKFVALDTWYKVLMYLGVILFGTGLTVELRGITNGEALLIGLAMFLIGIGEWKNHKVVAWINPPNIYTGGAALIQAKERRPDLFGLFLDFCGLIVLGFAIWQFSARTVLSAA